VDLLRGSSSRDKDGGSAAAQCGKALPYREMVSLILGGYASPSPSGGIASSRKNNTSDGKAEPYRSVERHSRDVKRWKW
jgi:hypothetical protein